MALSLKTNLSVVFPILVSLLSLSLSSARLAIKLSSEEITQACSSSEDPSFCSSFFNSAPGIAGANLLGAEKIAMKLAADNATATEKVIRSLLQNAGGDAKMKARLEDCSEFFQDAVRSIRGCLGKLDVKDYDTVLTYISAALDAGVNCSDEFQEPPAIPPMLVDGVYYLPKICSAILAVTKRLKGDYL